MIPATIRMVLLACLLPSIPLDAEPARKALLIGNAGYEGSLALRNPGNDVDDLAKALQALDFSVTVLKNLALEDMKEGVIGFHRRLAPGDLAFFYYSGHGLEIDGVNYLVPLGASIQEAFEVKREALEADYVLGALDGSGAAVKVVVLDCCRDNPLKRSWTRSAGKNAGLAMLAAPEGTLVAFSTAPNQVALDGDGRNSPYAGNLVQALSLRRAEGLELKEAFFIASRAVKEQSGQTPWVSMEASLAPVYLVWPATTPVTPEPKSSGTAAMVVPKPQPAPAAAPRVTPPPPQPQPRTWARTGTPGVYACPIDGRTIQGGGLQGETLPCPGCRGKFRIPD